MLDVAKLEIAVPPLQAVDDITIGTMLAACNEHASTPLIFTCGGNAVRPGYHVTEVKAGRFVALDCGGNPEAWSEIFIQLWDVMDGDRTHMTAGKFAAIIRKVSEHVALDQGAKLTFEVSDGVAPMQLHCASVPELAGGVLSVSLAPRAANCKPRDRWLDKHKSVFPAPTSSDPETCPCARETHDSPLIRL